MLTRTSTAIAAAGRVVVHHLGKDWFKRRYPVMSERIQSNSLSRRLVSGLARLKKASA
jgi:hypothetical protein